MIRFETLESVERALQIRVVQKLNVSLILDLIHVLEALKLWRAAYYFHAEGSWKPTFASSIEPCEYFFGKVGQVVKGIRQSVTKYSLSGPKRKTLTQSATTLATAARMRYHEYLAYGWPIASGLVESACENLIKDRMKRAGIRWTETS
jgi:hypothetical protein